MLAWIIARHYVQQPQRCAADDGAAGATDLGPKTAPKSKDVLMPDEEDAR